MSTPYRADDEEDRGKAQEVLQRDHSFSSCAMNTPPSMETNSSTPTQDHGEAVLVEQ